MSEIFDPAKTKELNDSADAMGDNAQAALAAMNARFAKMPRVTDEQAEDYDWTHSIVPRLRDVGLPARFHCRITNWSREPQKRAYEAVLSKCGGGNRGAIVALIGNRGTGKTFLAGQIIINATLRWYYSGVGFIPRYRKLTDILAMLKPIYSDFGSRDPESVQALRDTLCRYELLIIDEIHDCEEQRIKDRILTDILDRRYSNAVDTVLISNQTRADFEQHTNPSILSRMNEHGCLIECKWRPWR